MTFAIKVHTCSPGHEVLWSLGICWLQCFRCLRFAILTLPFKQTNKTKWNKTTITTKTIKYCLLAVTFLAHMGRKIWFWLPPNRSQSFSLLPNCWQKLAEIKQKGREGGYFSLQGCACGARRARPLYTAFSLSLYNPSGYVQFWNYFEAKCT